MVQSKLESSDAASKAVAQLSAEQQQKSSISKDPYFHISPRQQLEYLKVGREHAAGLAVDACCDLSKWRFVTQRGKLQVFALRSESSGSHSLLGMTRVRSSLDDFMRIMATEQRGTFQDLIAALHESDVRQADVLSSFGSLDQDSEQFSIKNFSLKSPQESSEKKSKKERRSSSSSRSSTVSSASSFDDGTAPLDMSLGRSTSTGTSQAVDDGGLNVCFGEYASIRHSGNARPSHDNRFGIISMYSLEDPQVTRYCVPMASNSSPNFAVSARTLFQHSGILVYPVQGKKSHPELEVVMKVTCVVPEGAVSRSKQAAVLRHVFAYDELENTLLVLRLRNSPYLTATNWVDDRSRKCCFACQQSFSSFRRRHHCRLCGEVACSKCSSVRQVKLTKQGGRYPFRICLQCWHGVEDQAPKIQRQEEGRERFIADLLPPVSNDETKESASKTLSIRSRKEEPIKLLDEETLRRSRENSDETASRSRENSDDTVRRSRENSDETVSRSRENSDEDRTYASAVTEESSAASTCSSSPPSPVNNVYARLSEMSLMEFHDSEYDLSLDDLRLSEEDDLRKPAFAVVEEGDELSDEEDVRQSDALAYDFHDDEADDSDEYLEEEELEVVQSMTIAKDTVLQDEYRLKVLESYGIMDSPKELVFDGIAKRAAQFLDCKVASVSFVDHEREFVKASYGMSSDQTMNIPLRHSLAAHIVRLGAKSSTPVWSVRDMTRDDVLATNMFVFDPPYLMSLIGVPIRGKHGKVLGALVLGSSREGSELTPTQQTYLTDLGEQLHELLEDRAQQRRQAQHEQKSMHNQLASLLSQTYRVGQQVQETEAQMLKRERSVEL